MRKSWADILSWIMNVVFMAVGIVLLYISIRIMASRTGITVQQLLVPDDRQTLLSEQVELDDCRIELKDDGCYLEYLGQTPTSMSFRVYGEDTRRVRWDAQPGEGVMRFDLMPGDESVMLWREADDRMLLCRVLTHGSDGWHFSTLNAIQRVNDIMRDQWSEEPLPEQSEELKTLAALILRDETDPWQQVKLIHDWISSHICYDYTAGGESLDWITPEQVLRDRKGVCAHYSKLFKGLCTAAGIPCRSVLGAAGENYTQAEELLLSGQELTGETINHAWNQVWLDGAWRDVDVTWDSSSYMREDGVLHFQEPNGWYYLAAEPETFSSSHLAIQVRGRAISEKSCPSRWARTDILNGLSRGLIQSDDLGHYRWWISRAGLEELVDNLCLSGDLSAEAVTEQEPLTAWLPLSLEQAAAELADAAADLGLDVDKTDPLGWCVDRGILTLTDQDSANCTTEQAMSAVNRLYEAAAA